MMNHLIYLSATLLSPSDPVVEALLLLGTSGDADAEMLQPQVIELLVLLFSARTSHSSNSVYSSTHEVNFSGANILLFVVAALPLQSEQLTQSQKTRRGIPVTLGEYTQGGRRPRGASQTRQGAPGGASQTRQGAPGGASLILILISLKKRKKKTAAKKLNLSGWMGRRARLDSDRTDLWLFI